MRRAAAIAVDYPRHFALLAAVSAVLGLAGRWRPALNPMESVGLYGVLHASSLAAALRPSPSLRRTGSFLVAASGFAMLSLEMARLVCRALAELPGPWPPVLLLTLSSGLGAASYGWLIRRCMTPERAFHAGHLQTLCCVTSTLVALPLGVHLHVVGGWWFAMIWWWTFSLTLWHQDIRVQT